MREASGRSRGFGFLTFKDPKVVNTVMVKEHFLDGKIVRPAFFNPSSNGQDSLDICSQSDGRKHRRLQRSQIDPKRAIPRDEQEKTSKIFVGGVSQDATEADFTAFFAQFGRVVDATLMMDKDTGRPRGFGFVTFDSEAAVEKCLAFHPLEILGKPIEVKKAQPRGKMGEEDDTRGGRGRGKFGRDDRFGERGEPVRANNSERSRAGNDGSNRHDTSNDGPVLATNATVFPDDAAANGSDGDGRWNGHEPADDGSDAADAKYAEHAEANGRPESWARHEPFDAAADDADDADAERRRGGHGKHGPSSRRVQCPGAASF